jgi:hypothetical protein
MVANGAATFYDSVPANVPADVTRYRDAQFGLELDHGLGEQSIIGPAVSASLSTISISMLRRC